MQIKKPPVVVVLGHIDHGKSTLIDYIRKTNTTAREAGGITQSIGAYQVSTGKNKSITFIDTPGHEAFEKMRSHGVLAADIAVLVVGADEGVKPQTIEAIKIIHEAKLPFIVALNKIDKPEANPQKIKQELTQHQVFVEGFGGDVSVVELSAKTGKGVKKLLDLITLVAEVEELKADPEKPAEGVVITSSLDSQRGIVATLMIKEGVLKEGDVVKLETTCGKVRAIQSFEGKKTKEAGPSSPVQVLGLEALPGVGEPFYVVPSLKDARTKTLPMKEEVVDTLLLQDNLLKFILKAKERASLDALEKLLSQVQTQYPEMTFQIIDKGVGDVAISDLDLAERFNAVIIGFQTKVLRSAHPLLQQKQIQVKLFDVIHDLPKLLEELIKQLFAPKVQTQEKSEMTVLAVFVKRKEGQVIGGKVTKGTIKKGMLLTIVRDGNMVGKGKIVNLQHLKKDVPVVEAGKECGLLFQGDAEVKVGDTLAEAKS